MQKRCVRGPAYVLTQVPSVQPESRRGRLRLPSGPRNQARPLADTSGPTTVQEYRRRMDRSTGVWILGGYQSDFARNLTQEGRDFAELTAEVVDLTLAAVEDRRVRHRRRSRRQRVRRDVRPPGPPRRDAGHGARRTVGHPGHPPRSRVRVGQRRDSVGDGRSALGQLQRRPGAWAWSWRRRCPATPPHSIWAPRPGRVTRGPTRGTCGRRCSPKSPTSTTGDTASTTRTCTRSRQLNFANARRNPNAQTRDWTVPDPIARRRRPGEPARGGPDPPLRLQPDDRRRGGRGPGQRRLPA